MNSYCNRLLIQRKNTTQKPWLVIGMKKDVNLNLNIQHFIKNRNLRKINIMLVS